MACVIPDAGIPQRFSLLVSQQKLSQSDYMLYHRIISSHYLNFVTKKQHVTNVPVPLSQCTTYIYTDKHFCSLILSSMSVKSFLPCLNIRRRFFSDVGKVIKCDIKHTLGTLIKGCLSCYQLMAFTQ